MLPRNRLSSSLLAPMLDSYHLWWRVSLRMPLWWNSNNLGQQGIGSSCTPKMKNYSCLASHDEVCCPFVCSCWCDVFLFYFPSRRKVLGLYNEHLMGDALKRLEQQHFLLISIPFQKSTQWVYIHLVCKSTHIVRGNVNTRSHLRVWSQLTRSGPRGYLE